MARRGSMKLAGCPTRIDQRFVISVSVARLSSAVSLSTLSTSRSRSIRPACPTEALDRRTSSRVCDDSRREPRGSIRTRRGFLRQGDLCGGGPWLAAEVLKVGCEHQSCSWHVDAAHHAARCADDRWAAGRGRW